MVSLADNQGKGNEADGDSFDLPADYKPYVPVAKRRKQLLTKLEAKKNRTTEEIERDRLRREQEEEDEERAREKARRERTLLQQAQEVKERKALEGTHSSALTTSGLEH
jgi:ATP-dependent RNA helicase DDX41